MSSFINHFTLVFLLSFYTFCKGTVTQTPTTACVGDRITISCTLTPPAGQTFTALTPRFLIGNSNAAISANNINNSNSHPGVDLTSLTAYVNAGSVTMVSGVVTLLSYLTSDEGLRIGCEVSLNTGMDLIENIQLIQAAPPSAPSLQSSVSNFNTATCSAGISLSWNTPSNRIVDRYFLYLEGFPLFTTNSNSYIHSTILNINTDYQYSVTAMSCAGNSTNNSSIANTIESYSLMRSSQTMCLAYDKVTRRLTVNWGLSAPIQPSGVSGLDITYSHQLLYSHSRQGVTYTYTDSTSFTLPSSQLSYNTVLTPHNFTQLDGVEINITANLMIVRQCGQSFSGTAMKCFLNSINPTTLPTSSIPISTSTDMSSSSTSIQMITTTVPSNTVSISSCSTLLPTSIILALLFLISLVVNLTLIIIVILLLIRNKQSKSPSKPAPSHPYEYIDLDKMSGNISSPTQQQSPQDYVPMNSISKQDTTQPPTHYANLK